jgi:hypothetical protein
MVLYFTSEAEAREGEGREPPPELQTQMAEMDKLSVGETEFFDLKRWILYSGRSPAPAEDVGHTSDA